jgi:hypothetical protein
MADRSINERILQGIRENSKGDESLRKFLADLLFAEAEHPPRWWYMQTYLELLKKYSKSGVQSNES